jgi:nucleotide-binding universal stress UspA family protein
MVSLLCREMREQTRSPMGIKREAAGCQEASMSFAAGMKTIVVATDLTGQSEAALGYARKLAGGYGARIVLAHGLDPMDYVDVDHVPGRLRKDLSEQARAVLEKLAGDLLREGIPSHSEIRQGAIAKMLLDVARQYEAGLIVIGTKGMSGAGPVIVGAIAEQLVRLSSCSVLAVAADWNVGEFRPTPGGPVLLAMERNEATTARRRPFSTPPQPSSKSLGSNRAGAFRCVLPSRTAIRQTWWMRQSPSTIRAYWWLG